MSEYQLGVCYCPEHWDETMWEADAAEMVSMGISHVRIGEFAWSRIEPSPREFTWGWLDRAMGVLASAGLKIILGTPTATPPKWLMDQHNDIIAVTDTGQPRDFGSRRHYCFSSQTYRSESARITTEFAKRYGHHPALGAWQTDNEYGCHNTVRSWSPMAQTEFRVWLNTKYGNIDRLNTAWGTVFWSQEYRSFDEIDLPNQTVTEPNPTHVLDFYRFSSDQVISFNKAQCDILRAHSDAPVSHNFMGHYYGFDHFKLARDLDIATWDSYPLGFLDQSHYSLDHKRNYLRQGDPDFAGFHHDLYRGCKDRWWVIEQQPGPVNWAPHNPAPLPGMVRTWTWEAFAHGAEVVSFFRWRQAPFAQEQFHAGLKRADNGLAIGGAEAAQVGTEISDIKTSKTRRSKVALLFSYEAKWMFDIQPQGLTWDYEALVLEWYRAARQLGLSLDIVSETDDLSDYSIVLVPSLPIINDGLLKQIKSGETQFIFGPRSGSKTENFHVPNTLAPGKLQNIIPLKVTHSESLRDAPYWIDHVETELKPIAKTIYQHENIMLLTEVLGFDELQNCIRNICGEHNIPVQDLTDGLRIRKRGNLTFAFNYASAPQTLPKALRQSKYILGSDTIPSGSLTCWREV